jgi:drug/metabolite transporter (DMT)-like permease
MLQGLPTLSLQNWLFTIWIAVVNTSLGFTLWNYVQRTLSAIESSIINSTMLVQVAIMAWLFLGEAITVKDVVGMALVSAGTLAVQLRGQRAASGAREPALQTGVEAAAEARAER